VDYLLTIIVIPTAIFQNAISPFLEHGASTRREGNDVQQKEIASDLNNPENQNQILQTAGQMVRI